MMSPLLLTLLVAAAPGGFEVAPYLHVRPGAGVHVGFVLDAQEGAKPSSVDDTTVLFATEGRIQKVPATLRAGVFLAEVPWACDIPEDATYFVPGMAAPAALPSWPCHDEDRVRFGFVTDTQQDVTLAAQASDLLATQQLDGVIHGGDIVNFGAFDAQWIELLAAMNSAIKSAPLIVAQGNHDLFFDNNGDHLDAYFGVKVPQSWFRTRIGPVQLIVLDSNHAVGDWGQQQKDFLEESLRTTDAPWTVVAFHHAIFSEGIAHSAIARATHTQRHDEMKALVLADLETAGVDLVLTGHTHLFERSRKERVEYVVGGAAGGIMGLKGGDNAWSLRSDPLRSVSIVEADHERLVVRSLDLDGNELDVFELRKPGVPIARGTGVGVSRRLPQHVQP